MFALFSQRHCLYVPLVMTILLCGCGIRSGESSRSLERLSERDSSGVELLQYALTEQSLKGLSDQTSRSTLELVSGDVLYSLSGIRALGGVAELEGGHFAVGMRNDYTVVILDSTGAVLRKVGKPGEGPGEFRRISDMAALAGGGFVVYDSRLLRLTTFDRDGNRLRVIGPLRSSERTGHALAGLAGSALDGIVMLEKSFDQNREGLFQDSTYATTVDSTGVRVRVMGAFPGDERYVGPPLADGSRQLAQPPFGARTLLTACGTDTFAADNIAGRIERYSMDGKLLMRAALGLPTIELTDKRIGAYIVAVSGSTDAATPEAIAQVRTMTPRGTLPILSSIRCQGDSGILVELGGDPLQQQRYLLQLSTDLRIRSVIAVPRRSQLISAGYRSAILAYDDEERGIVLKRLTL